MTLIKHNKICQNQWRYHEDGEALHADYNIISLDYWQKNKAGLTSNKSSLGLLVSGDELLENFIDDIEHFSLIAVQIPSFTDGRGYSLAKMLRATYHYTGEIRAVGDVLPDQALYLTRVGFDALELATATSADLALEKLTEFSVFYQPN